jgi:hypothetical protein
MLIKALVSSKISITFVFPCWNWDAATRPKFARTRLQMAPPLDLSSQMKRASRPFAALLEGKPFPLPSKSVCDECPTIREKKATGTVKRRLEAAEFTPGRPLTEMRCLMEQGILCHGPATRSGCGGSVGTPRCIRAYMPCEGCFGPLSDTANPMVDMMGALPSVRLDPTLRLLGYGLPYPLGSDTQQK